MLDTLLKIGEWQSRGKSKWDRFIDYPKPETEDRRGNAITNYTLPIIFDLDNKEVIIDSANLEEYDEEKAIETIPIKTRRGNNKAIYTSGVVRNLRQISKTFFGSNNDNVIMGELLELFMRDHSELLSNDFKALLNQIYTLRDVFFEQTIPEGNAEPDIRSINALFDLNNNEKIVFIVVLVKSEKLGYKELTSFSEIPEYIEFLEAIHFNINDGKVGIQEKLCYASGDLLKSVEILSLNKGYSLNKMFVTTTKNYATGFNDKNYHQNYQVDTQNQEYLDYASDYILNQGYRVQIANVDHVIIPQFMRNSKVDLEMALEGVQRKSDLLFNLKRLDFISENIGDWIENENDIFWINFIAYESDGNFFKSTEVIKDVSRFHFEKLITALSEVDEQFRQSGFVDWNAVMTGYDSDTKERTLFTFNFNSLYKIIPLRRGKEKKNKALDLFKTILENRKVDETVLYDYFTELILCHYYERYASYTNVQKYGKDYFYIAVRDSVFKYLAFFELLKKLKLIDMEDTTTSVENVNQYDQAESDFFKKMNFNQEQRAMFYLGRMLNSVEYLQHGKNMTVIQKVNFNGMDKDSIQRLRIDLIEKAKQYNAMNRVVFTDQKFGNEFDFNNWSLSPQEAIFFLLTGYSFGAGKKTNNTN